MYTIEKKTLTDIADAIREKTGKSGLILPGDMPEEISSVVAHGDGGEVLFSDYKGGASGKYEIATTLTVTKPGMYYMMCGGWTDTNSATITINGTSVTHVKLGGYCEYSYATVALEVGDVVVLCTTASQRSAISGVIVFLHA